VKKLVYISIVFSLLLVLSSCGEFRSDEVVLDNFTSQDDKTYLVIKRSNGKMCQPLLVNGKVWDGTYKTEVEPGIYRFACHDNRSAATLARGFTLKYSDAYQMVPRFNLTF
jgi:hypothetical protein